MVQSEAESFDIFLCEQSGGINYSIIIQFDKDKEITEKDLEKVLILAKEELIKEI